MITAYVNAYRTFGEQPFLNRALESAKYFKENCLLDQPFVKDPDITVGDYRKKMVSEVGENIHIRRYVRFQLGEGLEKRSDDFAAEVAAQMQDG